MISKSQHKRFVEDVKKMVVWEMRWSDLELRNKILNEIVKRDKEFLSKFDKKCGKIKVS